jgi:2'-5' RNA ligase
MRLFVAVELDAYARQVAEGVAKDLAHRLGSTVRPRWVRPENMHLTVRFIGHVAADRTGSILDALRPPLSIAPFELVLGDCGMFASQGAPTVLWIGVREGLASLQAMQRRFNDRLLPFGVEAETRPYSGHLTLARVKGAPRGSSAMAREAVRTTRFPAVSCTISEVTVFESRLSSSGPTYVPLLRIPLGRSG